MAMKNSILYKFMDGGIEHRSITCVNVQCNNNWV